MGKEKLLDKVNKETARQFMTISHLVLGAMIALELREEGVKSPEVLKWIVKNCKK